MAESAPAQARPPRKVGRPGALGDVPAGASHRSIRLTDAEWEAVRALVRRLRTAKKPMNSSAK